MKSQTVKLAVLFTAIAGVVAWSPPNSEDLVVGGSNTIDSTPGYVGVVGNSNTIKGHGMFVVGNSNNVPNVDSRHSAIIGRNNGFNNGRECSLVVGISNTVNANTSLISGHTNTVEGSGLGVTAWHSAAIGYFNQIMTSPAWTMGHTNEITGAYGTALGTANNVSNTYGTALGRGLTVTNSDAVALGRWNAPMNAEDIVVVGTGDATTRETALRITNGGGVILGRSQGDIAMGDYAN